MATAQEKFKLSANAKFTVLARAVADAISNGEDPTHYIQGLAAARWLEYQRIAHSDKLAALGRMLGDAYAQGEPLEDLLADIRAVRLSERTGRPLSQLRTRKGKYASLWQEKAPEAVGGGVNLGETRRVLRAR